MFGLRKVWLHQSNFGPGSPENDQIGARIHKVEKVLRTSTGFCCMASYSKSTSLE